MNLLKSMISYFKNFDNARASAADPGGTGLKSSELIANEVETRRRMMKGLTARYLNCMNFYPCQINQ
jgi:hypothetical protein